LGTTAGATDRKTRRRLFVARGGSNRYGPATSPAKTQERRRSRVIVHSVSELIHTCYRVLDLDRSIAFYEKLGMEEIGRMSIRDEAINVYMGLPGDGPRLELTYNLGRTEPYEIGTGYGHIAAPASTCPGLLRQPSASPRPRRRSSRISRPTASMCSSCAKCCAARTS
jgi:lactoylglutathione lyase